MKIYFVYRTGYVPNHRITKTMEANSMLEWFQQHWDDLCHDEKKLLGFDVYGFPILRREEVETIAPPQDIKELEEILLKNLSLNSLSVAKDCVIGFTSDDKIELAWAIFTEDYALKFSDNTLIWLQDSLPTDFHQEPIAGVVKGIKTKLKGSEKCNTYYLSTMIIDSNHFEYLSKPVIMEGVSLPYLMEFFKQDNSSELRSDRYGYKKTELLFLQHLTKSVSLMDIPHLLGKVDTNIQTLPHTASAHLMEISMRNGDCYDYMVLFDDYWYAQHPLLAKSLINFHKKAILGKSLGY